MTNQQLETGKLYVGAALVRHVVEVEYLAWAFGAPRDQWLSTGMTERLGTP